MLTNGSPINLLINELDSHAPIGNKDLPDCDSHSPEIVAHCNMTIIVDLNSKNGTYVNGKRVKQQVLINDDIIAMGDHRIKFIDPASTRRQSLQGTKWDESTITKSVEKLRAVLTGEMRTKRAS